jgi:hypothetical protein
MQVSKEVILYKAKTFEMRQLIRHLNVLYNIIGFPQLAGMAELGNSPSKMIPWPANSLKSTISSSIL